MMRLRMRWICTMHSMAVKEHNAIIESREETGMEEKIYKTMNGAGAMNIVLGVIALAVGVATGVLLIISGSKLLSGKSKILF